MSLINQQLDCAITKGNSAKFIRYLYDNAIEYIKNQEKYDNINMLYYEFTSKCCEKLSIDKTRSFVKVLERKM